MGEAEKLVRALFMVAKSRQPSVIFMDEVCYSFPDGALFSRNNKILYFPNSPHIENGNLLALICLIVNRLIVSCQQGWLMRMMQAEG